MNKYEIMFILKSNEEEAIKNQVSELKAIITDMNFFNNLYLINFSLLTFS